MTKEEILEEFEDINFMYNDSSKHDMLKRMLEELEEDQESLHDEIDALKRMLVKLVEEFKESTLNKIEVEIQEAYCRVENNYDRGRNYGLYTATQIIDKYRAESEV